LKETGMIRRRGILKIEWLLTINGFVERTMKKGVFHIKLMNRPGERDRHIENSTYSARLNNETKKFIIINTVLLRITVIDLRSFVTGKTTKSDFFG
jgi:hypothetical protein